MKNTHFRVLTLVIGLVPFDLTNYRQVMSQLIKSLSIYKSYIEMASKLAIIAVILVMLLN